MPDARTHADPSAPGYEARAGLVREREAADSVPRHKIEKLIGLLERLARSTQYPAAGAYGDAATWLRDMLTQREEPPLTDATHEETDRA